MVAIVLMSFLFLIISIQASDKSNLQPTNLSSAMSHSRIEIFSKPLEFQKIITPIETRYGSRYFAIVDLDLQTVKLTPNGYYESITCQGINDSINLSDGRTVCVLSTGYVKVEEK